MSFGFPSSQQLLQLKFRLLAAHPAVGLFMQHEQLQLLQFLHCPRLLQAHPAQPLRLLQLALPHLRHLRLPGLGHAGSLGALVLAHLPLLAPPKLCLLLPAPLDALLDLAPPLLHLQVVLRVPLPQLLTCIAEALPARLPLPPRPLLCLFALALPRQQQLGLGLPLLLCLLALALKEGEFLLVGKCLKFVFLLVDLQDGEPASQRVLAIVDLLQFAQRSRAACLLLGRLRSAPRVLQPQGETQRSAQPPQRSGAALPLRGEPSHFYLGLHLVIAAQELQSGWAQGRSGGEAGRAGKGCGDGGKGILVWRSGQIGSKVYQDRLIITTTFNMSETQQLLQIISNVLQPQDANLRKEAEEILKNLRAEKPNELMLAYLEILKSKTPLECRNFSASQLRLCLSEFSPSTYSNLWAALTPEVQEKIKTDLFVAIYSETDLSMKKHIADTIGEVAGSLISKEDAAWPAFKTNVWQLLQDANLNSVFGGFYILESFFSYAPDHFKDNANDLYALFNIGLSHENGKLKLSALRCFGSYLEVLEPKKQGIFQGLVLNIYEAVYLLIEKDNEEEGLEALSEMLEVEPKFFRKTFKELVELLTRIFKVPNIEGGVRRMTTEILVDFAEKSPTIFRKKKEALKSTIEMVFYHMIEISSEITQEWMRPAEGYNDDMEDDEDFETTRFGMGAIDRLIYTIGEEEMLPILSQTIELMLTNADWRYKYTAVMALSQIGEYIEDVDKISSVLHMIVGFLKHENPMMRYAACHAIGQISDDMQPKFQEKFGDAIFPELLALLQADPVPRVVSHSAAALTNFLEGMKWEQVASRLELLVSLLLNLAVNGISLVKESALSALSSTVEIAKERYVPYLSKTLEVLFSYYNNQQYAAREYKQLKGQAIETLTIIASSVGADLFRPAANQLITLMINLQSSQFEQTDPQKSYILAGWQRLCLVYGRELGSHLSQILPGLFALVERVVREEIELIGGEEKEEEAEGADGQNINTHDTEEAEVAISMLNVFIEQLGPLYNPYVEQTVNLLCKIIREHPNEDVKEEACKCLPNLIIAVKTENSPLAVNLAKLFMGTLVETMEKEYDSQIVIVELETLKSVLEELGLQFLNEQEIKDFSEKMLKLLKNADEKKVLSKEGLNEEDLDEEEKEMVDDEIKQEEEVQVAISELIGALFKTHKTMTIGLAHYLIYNILPKVFVDNQTENMLKFGIFLIDDIVEFLGYDLLPNEWASFANVLLKYANENSCVLRQAACYGLGIFAERTPSSILNAETLQLWLNALLEAVKIAKGSEKEKTYGHCRDNGIAAIGKIIKAHFALFDPKPYLAIWLNFLPLKHDKDEGMLQNELLIDIMTSSPDYILGEDRVQGIQRVLSIYGEIAGNKKLYNDGVAKKLKAHILALNADPFFSQNVQHIWTGITDKHRESLTSFMK